MSKDSIKLALSVLEDERGNLTPEELQRLVELVGVGESVRITVEDALEVTEKCELSSEQANQLIGTLKSRFEESENGEVCEAIDFADVEKSLRASPEDLFALNKLEETGGEPQIVGVDGDEFIFEDRCLESPTGRINRNFDEADAQRESFGSNVEFQSEDSYKAMQKTGEYDSCSWNWLKTEPEYRGRTGRALFGFRGGGDVYVDEAHADYRNGDWGWRASLRVKKA